MDTIIEKLVLFLFSGGPQAIIAALLIAILFLIMERRRLLSEISRKDEKIDKIIDDYYKGNMTLSEALNGLKLVLYELKSKL